MRRSCRVVGLQQRLVLLMAPPEKHAKIVKKFGNARVLPFSIDRRGSRIIFISDRYRF